MKNPLANSIQAILFAVSEPQSIKSLAARLETDEASVKEALSELAGMLEGHGIMPVVHENTVTLATRPEYSVLIESIRKEELSKELSRASAETLAIVAYHPGATKAQIEFIRGVNASYSLRALQIRGLIEQKGGGRSVTYSPTIECLEYFGAGSVEELPNYAQTKQKIDALLNHASEEGSEA